MASVAEPPQPSAPSLPRASTHAMAQRSWSALPVKARLAVFTKFRQLVAADPRSLLDAIPLSLSRTRADSFAAELLPLLAACQYLEREAVSVLRTRHLSGNKPFWLHGVESSVERVALGAILVIAPANYPLFLPGVQTLQALAAGNSVTWKPGRNGREVAQQFCDLLGAAGLPDDLLRITDESVEVGREEIMAGVDKIFFTGSSVAGRSVLQLAAASATPVVAELSGCDAVFVLPGANHQRVADALTFGMRLNGSATCMAPRRLMLVGGGHGPLISLLKERFASVGAVILPSNTLNLLRELVADAACAGASVTGDLRSDRTSPILVLDARPEMPLARADVFAPVLSVMQFVDEASALAAEEQCPYGLTASVFGPESEARRFSSTLKVGTILINDLIVPTADPRVPFGGRRGSGYGVTRGAEGLLEMTTPRTILVRHGGDTRHFQPTGPAHEALFAGVSRATHAQAWRTRISGFKQMMQAVKKMSPSENSQKNEQFGSKK